MDDEVAKDSGLLKRERGKAAALIEGVLSRQSDLYTLSDDEYDAVGDSPAFSSSARSHSRSLRHKSRRNSYGHDTKKIKGNNAFGKVEEYIENNTVKSSSLWKKVEGQVQEKHKTTSAGIASSNNTGDHSAKFAANGSSSTLQHLELSSKREREHIVSSTREVSSSSRR